MPAPLLFKVVHQTRYADGELYWDLSGRVRRALMASAPGWEFVDRPDSNFWRGKVKLDGVGAPFKGLYAQMNFGSLACDFAFDAPADTRFEALNLVPLSEAITSATDVILLGLAVQRVTRVGLRGLLVYPYGDESSAVRAMNALEGHAPIAVDQVPAIGTEIRSEIVRRFKVRNLETRVALTVGTCTYGGPRPTNVPGIILDVDVALEPKQPARAELAEHAAAALAYITEAHRAFGVKLRIEK